MQLHGSERRLQISGVIFMALIMRRVAWTSGMALCAAGTPVPNISWYKFFSEYEFLPGLVSLNQSRVSAARPPEWFQPWWQRMRWS